MFIPRHSKLKNGGNMYTEKEQLELLIRIQNMIYYFKQGYKMKKLDKVIKKNGFNYTQVIRNENFAVYEQIGIDAKEKPYLAGYEVFKIRTQKDTTMTVGGKEIKLEEKELFANNNMFGSYAWSFNKKESAIDKFNELTIEESKKQDKLISEFI